MIWRAAALLRILEIGVKGIFGGYPTCRMSNHQDMATPGVKRQNSNQLENPLTPREVKRQFIHYLMTTQSQRVHTTLLVPYSYLIAHHRNIHLTRHARRH